MGNNQAAPPVLTPERGNGPRSAEYPGGRSAFERIGSPSTDKPHDAMRPPAAPTLPNWSAGTCAVP